jgi:hypothetical protein
MLSSFLELFYLYDSSCFDYEQCALQCFFDVDVCLSNKGANNSLS